MRYIAVDRDVLRPLLFEDAPLADLLLSTFMSRREALQQRQGVGLEIVGPARRPQTRADGGLGQAQPPARTAGATPSTPTTRGRGARPGARPTLPLVRLPGGADLLGPSNGELSRALGIGLELAAARGGRPRWSSAEGRRASAPPSTALPRVSTRWSWRARRSAGRPARHGGSRTTSASRPASPATSSPAARSPRRASSARVPPRPYRALALEPGGDRHVVRLEEDHEVSARAVVLATGADYRRLPVDGLEEYEGLSVFYAAGPPEAQRCAATRVGVVGGGNSAGQAAVWLARGGALVTLLHRRADLRETMSDYLVGELERYGVAVRDRSEIAELHGSAGELEAVTLRRRRAAALRLPVPVPRRRAVHRLARRLAWRATTKGFVLTGAEAGAEGLLETSVPGDLRRRRRALGLGQALRHRGRRGRDGRPLRPRADGGAPPRRLGPDAGAARPAPPPRPRPGRGPRATSAARGPSTPTSMPPAPRAPSSAVLRAAL